jgi:hypothetical protein
MLFRKKMSEMTGRRMMGFGMLALGLGIAMSRIGSMRLGISDFSEGFCLGFGIVMLMASIVLNTSGFMKLRTERTER